MITAADAGQQAAYEAQVAAELAQGNLPARPQWLVVADKPGAKIGPGGSTLFVLSVLQAQLGDALDAMRVLLIHAGGYSQRLPSMSVCGKIFAPMPVSRRCLGAAAVPYRGPFRVDLGPRAPHALLFGSDMRAPRLSDADASPTPTLS